MNELQLNWNIKIARDVIDMAFHLTHRKRNWRKLLIVHSKGGRCNLLGFFTAMIGDRHDKLAAIDLSMIHG